MFWIIYVWMMKLFSRRLWILSWSSPNYWLTNYSYNGSISFLKRNFGVSILNQILKIIFSNPSQWMEIFQSLFRSTFSGCKYTQSHPLITFLNCLILSSNWYLKGDALNSLIWRLYYPIWSLFVYTILIRRVIIT